MRGLLKVIFEGICTAKGTSANRTFCFLQRDIERGCKLHSIILKWGLLERSPFIGNTLMSMYIKCGALVQARGLFDQFPARDVASWTLLISGYADHGHVQEALQLFEKMQHEGEAPNAFTLSCMLKVCGLTQTADKGRELHALILRKGLLMTDTVLGNALLDMYAKWGALTRVHHVFHELPNRNLVTWNALIAGYCQQGEGEAALHLFRQMKEEGFAPDSITFLSAVKACSCIEALKRGSEVHTEIVRRGILENHDVLANALTDMYARCGAFTMAQDMLKSLSTKNIIAWTALMAGYSQFGRSEDTLCCFESLRQEGLYPNTVTYISALNACASLKAIDVGKKIHGEVVSRGLLGMDPTLGSTLVYMYCKCGELAKAQELFEELPARDVVSWTVLIMECCENNHGEKALGYFDRMRCEGFSPDEVALLCVLKVCGSIGAVEKGDEVYVEIARKNLIGKLSILSSALVDMYAKCHALAKAQEVFDMLPSQDVSSWTALISGYCQIGQHDVVLQTFSKMILRGPEPNVITFMVVLSACGILGLVHEGQIYYHVMSSYYGIIPISQHHTCMVNLFGREGQLEKAMAMLEKIPPSERLPACFALLNSCKNLKSMKIARFVFKNAIDLDAM
ncbi:hypothetical protein KP509_34G009900 [Ceratopteris richardii]|uniref:Pentatricopeptide repeat-containing protein n=1 Tax=Ceratopteris richardii TaxID=49495 RepID=A0A8T2QIL5_CERRI|nr:hypothetical protein KP509_34G009900 [Ceratopteris richardii]